MRCRLQQRMTVHTSNERQAGVKLTDTGTTVSPKQPPHTIWLRTIPKGGPRESSRQVVQRGNQLITDKLILTVRTAKLTWGSSHICLWISTEQKEGEEQRQQTDLERSWLTEKLTKTRYKISNSWIISQLSRIFFRTQQRKIHAFISFNFKENAEKIPCVWILQNWHLSVSLLIFCSTWW